jgi:hypothetical protein
MNRLIGFVAVAVTVVLMTLTIFLGQGQVAAPSERPRTDMRAGVAGGAIDSCAAPSSRPAARSVAC